MDLSDGADGNNADDDLSDVQSVVHGASLIPRIRPATLTVDIYGQRFENIDVAREYVDRWKNRRVCEERRFVHNHSSQFETMIDSRGWRKYTSFPVRKNVDIFREFYASVSYNLNRSIAFVRGVPIIFTPTDINSFLGLPDLNEKEFNNSPLFDIPYTVNMACNLLCPDAPWLMKVIPSHHNSQPASRFRCEFGEWRSFVMFRLLPPHLSYTINRHQLTLICTLLRGDNVDMGLTMHHLIKQTARDFGVAGLPYGTFITALAKRSGVKDDGNDILIISEVKFIDAMNDDFSSVDYSEMRDFLIYCAQKGLKLGCPNCKQ